MALPRPRRGQVDSPLSSGYDHTKGSATPVVSLPESRGGRLRHLIHGGTIKWYVPVGNGSLPALRQSQ